MKSSLLMRNPVYPHTLQVLKGQRVGPNSVKTLGQELKRATGSRKSTLGGPADRLPPARF